MAAERRKRDLKEGLYNRRNSSLVVLIATVLDTGLVTRSVRRKTKNDAQAHVTSRTLQGTVHVCPKSFVMSPISAAQELRRAGACDTCCDRTVAGQEWMNDFVHSLEKTEIDVLDAAASRTFQVWSR